MPGRARLLRFALGTLTALVAVELAVRVEEPLFAAASHRVLAKAALLDRHGHVEVLFFGTSRTQDGVSPSLVSDELARAGGPRVRAFNLASTASSLETLDYLAQRFAGRPGLELAVVEVSEPQLVSAALPWLPDAAPRDGEQRLLAWTAARVRLVEHRSFLIGENLARLPALLLLAPRLDGSEVTMADQLAAALGARNAPAPPFDLASWAPTIWTASQAAAQSPAPPNLEALVSLARRLSSGGARVAFVVPPLAPGAHAPEREKPLRDLFAALAQETHCPVWDYSGIAAPADLFRGETHLAPAGRAQFSRALAQQIAASGLLSPGEGR